MLHTALMISAQRLTEWARQAYRPVRRLVCTGRSNLFIKAAWLLVVAPPAHCCSCSLTFQLLPLGLQEPKMLAPATATGLPARCKALAALG